jgi:hypothetical protein
VSYAVVSWEISTADPGRAAMIGQVVRNALATFAMSAPLLVNTAIMDTDDVNVENIRRELDRVASTFPQEFFYTASDVVDSDIQGIYPPWSNLAVARQITGQARNPRNRQPQAVAVARPTMAGRAAPAAVRKTRRRPQRPTKAGRRGSTSAKRRKK